MKLEALHIGMKVRHPQYGVGTVKTLGEQTAEIRFEDQQRTIEPESAGLGPAEPQVVLSGLSQPLALFLEETVAAAVRRLGLEKPDSVLDQILPRWHHGRLTLHPGDPTLQSKEVPLEIFFHKIVMMRNHLRVLEQKINAHEKLTDAEKIDM